MSQHDFEIANQGFPSFRSDLNSGLQALASNSAGATEPSSTYAYQFWYDETTDLLKLRNSDDDAWITLAAFDQTNDEWEIRSAVIQAVDSAGVTIKDDSGTTLLAVADGGGVTITDNASNGGLSVEGSASPRVIVEDTTNNAQAFLEAGDSITRVGSLSNHSLEFRTNNSAEMTLNTSGNLAIGRSDAQVAGIELYKSAPIIRWTDSNNDSYAEIRGNNGNFAIRADHGNTQSGSGISLEVDGSLILLVDGLGLSFDGGSNYLDDYEEGTWTPVITSGFSSGAGSYSSQAGGYVKIGKLVSFQLTLDPNSVVANSTIIKFGGLPFTSDGNTTSNGAAFISYQGGYNTNTGDSYHVPGGTTEIAVYTNGGGSRNGNSSGINLNALIILTGSYYTDA